MARHRPRRFIGGRPRLRRQGKGDHPTAGRHHVAKATTPNASGKGATEEEFIPLEEATSQIYGATRNTELGKSAETMNTNGVLVWYAWYLHTKEIPIYGNVRNSTRREPVQFENLDLKMEGTHIVGKKIYGDLIWENMCVGKSDLAAAIKAAIKHAGDLEHGRGH
jgi:hypothetical protein